MDAAIGIDIGGTSTKLAVINSDGRISSKRILLMREFEGEKDYLKAISNSIQSLIATHQHYNIIGIGIGSPGCIPEKGVIKGAVNLPFTGEVAIKYILEANFNIPTHLVKDGNAAALGEGQFGAAKGMKNFIVLTLGTGLGCGIIANNTVISGNFGQAGELGHHIIKKNGRKCTCGRKGCLETYVSATGIKRTLFKLLGNSTKESLLRDITYNELTPKRVYQAAQQGDSIAKKAFQYTGKILGKQLAGLATIFEPEAFFLAGGLAEAGDLLFQPTIESLEHQVFKYYKGKIKVLPSGLKTNEAALLGAASLVWKNQFTVAEITN